MFMLPPISSGLEFWSHKSYFNIWKFWVKLFKKMNILGEVSNNRPNSLLGANIYKTLKSCR